MGDLQKNISIIIFFAVLIAGIILGNSIGSSNRFNFGVALAVWVVGASFAAPIYTTGEQLSLQERILSELKAIRTDINKIKIENAKQSFPDAPSHAAHVTLNNSISKTMDGGWFCKSCKTNNPKNSSSCSGCGKYK